MLSSKIVHRTEGGKKVKNPIVLQVLSFKYINNIPVLVEKKDNT